MALSTAKQILRGYRKEGRIGPKITRTKFRHFEPTNPTNTLPVRNKYIISYKEENGSQALVDI